MLYGVHQGALYYFVFISAYFKNCSAHNRWNKSEQLSWLKGSLENAGQLLRDLSPESTDVFQKLVDASSDSFKGFKQTDKHRIELRYRKRKPNESLTDLLQDISRLMAFAHPQLAYHHPRVTLSRLIITLIV